MLPELFCKNSFVCLLTLQKIFTIPIANFTKISILEYLIYPVLADF